MVQLTKLSLAPFVRRTAALLLLRAVAEVALHTVWNCAHGCRFFFDAPLLFERLQRLGLDMRMSTRQHQHRRWAYARANQSQILSRIEQARIPALPGRQQELHLLAQAATILFGEGCHSGPFTTKVFAKTTAVVMNGAATQRFAIV